MGYETAPSTLMLATNCVFCGKALRDAESVERGCGPDCAEKYFMWGGSSGVDEASFLEAVATAPDPVKMVSEGGIENPPAAANRLIHLGGSYWQQSPTPEGRLVVASTAEVLRALGYSKAADKIVSRYVVGERQGPPVHGFEVEKLGDRTVGFALPTRLDSASWRNIHDGIRGAGARSQKQNDGRWLYVLEAEGPSDRVFLLILNVLSRRYAGELGVWWNGEVFVVPEEPMPVPGPTPAVPAGPPVEQTGEAAATDPTPQVAPLDIDKGSRVVLSDGREMIVGWIGGDRVGIWSEKERASWLAQSPRSRGRPTYTFVGKGELRMAVPTTPEVDAVEEQTEETVSRSTKQRELPEEMMGYQREGAAWLDDRGSGILAFDMGLGKTLVALSVIDPPAVVVCPASLRINWVRECNRWRPDLTCVAVGLATGKKREEAEREAAAKADVVVCSYEWASKESNREFLEGRKNATIAVDEAHYLKELRVSAKRQGSEWVTVLQGSKRGQAVWELAQTIRRRFLLTGTPMINGRNYELFPLLHLVAPDHYRTFRSYCMRFCPPEEKHVGGGRIAYSYNENANSGELNREISGKFMLRKTKDELDLPEKSRRSIEIMLDPDVAKEYRDAAAEFLEWVRERGGAEAAFRASRAEAIAKMTALRKLSAIGKAETVAAAVAQHVMGTGTPLIVMAHHRDAIELLAKALDEVKEPRAIRYGFVTGWVSPAQKQAAIDEFQQGVPADAPPNERRYLDVLLCSIQAAGVGLTLTRAQDMIFLERTWRPFDLVQAEDRIHRIGQKNKCTITYYDGSNTIDMKIAKMLKNKVSTAAQVIDGQDLSDADASDLVFGEMFPIEMSRNGDDEDDDDTWEWADPT
jgi:superfamily II DNA or RNA helicase